MSLPNIWHLRTVAEPSAKPCYVCYKPSPSVLITPDNKDYFYICRNHLKDKGFCSPIIDQDAEAQKKKKEELEQEIELIKKEYDEKMKKKAKEKKSKDKDKEKEDEDSKKAEKEKDDKVVIQIKAITNMVVVPSNSADEIPRIYALHKNFHQMRLDRIRNAEISRRNRERLKNPSAFPSVPVGDL